jgi:uncharacterized protein (TIGR03083 family)
MDPIEEWTNAQSRVIELVEGISADDAEKTVPACPDWTVRNLLSHMIGLDADVIDGDEPDDHNPTWTQRQVDERADHDVAALVSEWRELTAPLQDWMRSNGARPMGDVIIHEQDLRGALGQSGAHGTDGLRALRDRMAGGFTAAVEKDGLGAIELVSPEWTLTAGDGAAVVTVTASEFDLTRALMSRRSADQLRSWTTDGDVEPYLSAFGALGPLPESALTE